MSYMSSKKIIFHKSISSRIADIEIIKRSFNGSKDSEKSVWRNTCALCGQATWDELAWRLRKTLTPEYVTGMCVCVCVCVCVSECVCVCVGGWSSHQYVRLISSLWLTWDSLSILFANCSSSTLAIFLTTIRASVLLSPGMSCYI